VRSVWERDNGTYACVQTWTTNYNSSFKSEYTIRETNPDTALYVPQAVDEFQRACLELFGGTPDECPVLFCHREARNEHRAYVGTSATLLGFLIRQPHVMAEMEIAEITTDGFVASTVDKNGNRGSKPFHMAAEIEYVLYKKVGWHSMACVTPLEQFVTDREFLPI
jgi:hypothetical protein